MYKSTLIRMETITGMLSKDITEVMEADCNKVAFSAFKDALKGLKPKKCKVKVGWTSGEKISFIIHFEKGGNEDPMQLFFDAIENKSDIFHFINGLAPEIFAFDPKYVVDDKDNFIIEFRLKRS